MNNPSAFDNSLDYSRSGQAHLQEPKPEHPFAAADSQVRADTQFNEADHPRDEKGQFAPSASQKASLKHYTAAGFKPINWALRGIRQMTPEAQKHIDELDKYLSKQSIDKDTILYRGIGSSGVKAIMAAGIEKGSVYVDPGFLSTSRNSRVSKEFANSEGSIILEMRVKKGAKAADIGQYSDAPFEEEEVLFARNTKMKVLSYNKKSKTLVVEVRGD